MMPTRRLTIAVWAASILSLMVLVGLTVANDMAAMSEHSSGKHDPASWWSRLILFGVFVLIELTVGYQLLVHLPASSLVAIFTAVLAGSALFLIGALNPFLVGMLDLTTHVAIGGVIATTPLFLWTNWRRRVMSRAWLVEYHPVGVTDARKFLTDAPHVDQAAKPVFDVGVVGSQRDP